MFIFIIERNEERKINEFFWFLKGRLEFLVNIRVVIIFKWIWNICLFYIVSIGKVIYSDYDI